MNTASPKTYDHRLRNLVHATQDISIALHLGVPRSTAYGWIRNERPEVVTLDDLDLNKQQLQYELISTTRKSVRICRDLAQAYQRTWLAEIPETVASSQTEDRYQDNKTR